MHMNSIEYVWALWANIGFACVLLSGFKHKFSNTEHNVGIFYSIFKYVGKLSLSGSEENGE